MARGRNLAGESTAPVLQSRGGSIRRLVAALSSLLLLQLTLLGSGTLCATHSGEASTTYAHDMASMAGTGQSDASASTTLATRALPSDGQQAPHPCGGAEDGCGLPWAPGQCASMTSCSVTAAPPTIVAVQLERSQGVSYLPEPGSIGSRAATPPELPPPRA